MKLSEIPPTRAENYSYLPNMWEHQKRQSLKDYMRWYNNKDVVPILEAMRKIVVSYQNKRIDMLNLRLTLPKLAKICLHSSSGAKLCPFTEGDKDLLEKVWEDMVGEPWLVFTRKVVVDRIHIHNSTIVCKAVTGKDAGQFYPYSVCQPMTTKKYTRYEFDADLQRFKPVQNRSRSLETMVMSYF